MALKTASAAGLPVCVSNNTEFKAALLNAELVPATIQLVRGGSYDFANSIWDDGWSEANPAYIQPGSELLGGYAAGCASRNIEAGNTVVGYSNANGYGPGVVVYGDLTIEGVTFSTGVTLDVTDDNGHVQSEPKILMRRDVFTAVGPTFSWILDDDVGGTLRIVDTLIAGITQIDCSLYIEVTTGSPDVQLVHDTIYDNTGATGTDGSGACMYNGVFHDNGHGRLLAYNNIFYGNTNRDLDTDAAVIGPVLVDNVMGPHHTPGAIESGTLNTDPRLDADYRPIESPPSPVINTGSTTAPGGLPATDLPGRDRVVGTAPDRGAYESNVNDAFLQTVSTASDSGAGSLRNAILGANAHGSGLITFDLGTGCGPHVITLTSPLPTITAPLIVNGYSQAGSAPNDLDLGDDATFCVVLESGDVSVTRGLTVTASAGDGVSLFVEGLAFSDFRDAAVSLGSGSGHIVVGNRFGGSVGGHQLFPNGIGVRLDAAAHDSTVGGDDDGARNILSGSNGSGLVVFEGSHDNQIVANLVGVGWSGDASGHFTNLGNSARGLYIAGRDNEISGNWIGDNAQAGIAVANGGATGNTIENNHVGFNRDTTQFGNGQAGIHFEGSAGDAPSGNTVVDNVIFYNIAQGVWVEIGQQNKIRRNSIGFNYGLGIDLADAGVLPNDNDAAAEPPDYANRGLNYPELSSAAGGYAHGTFSGLLESTIGDYRIDFYQNPGGCDAQAYRQGNYWLGSTLITISLAQVGGNGVQSFAAFLGSGSYPILPDGAGITTTATDATGNTSEFSACVPYVNDTIFADGFEPNA